MSEKGFMNENDNDWFGYLTSAEYQPFSHHKKKQKETKPHEEHMCQTQIHRVDRYTISSGKRGGWFVEGHSEKIDIEYCPYCGVKLDK